MKMQTIHLNARDVAEAIEDIGIGEVAIQCFWNLFVRVLSDPMLLPFKQSFLLGLEATVQAHRGMGKGVVTMHEMLDGYAQLTDALRRIHRARPQMKIGKSSEGLRLLIEQIDGCLKWG